MLKPIHFGTCCVPEDASWMVNILAFFGNYPSWLIVANFALGTVNRDIYFLVASNVQLFLLAIYLDLIANLLRVRRPPWFDHELCESTKYAFPDPLFIPILSFSLTALFAFLQNAKLRQFLNPLTTVIVVVLLFGYLASTLVSGYFNALLLIANTVLAFVVTTLCILFYGVIVRDFRLMAPLYMKKFVGGAGALLGKDCTVLNPDCNR